MSDNVCLLADSFTSVKEECEMFWKSELVLRNGPSDKKNVTRYNFCISKRACISSY